MGPGTYVSEPSVLVMARSDTGAAVSVSVALLLPRLGSVVPAGAATVAVVAGAVVLGVGVVGRRDGDGVEQRTGGRRADLRHHGVGDAGAGGQAADGVAQGAGHIRVAVAAPAEGGHPSRQRVADRHAGG